MSETKVVTAVVEELSKYGFKSNGRYVNYSKSLKEADKALVVPGASFEAEYFVSDSGKEYLNRIIKSVTAKTESKAKAKPEEAKKETKGEAMTRSDWDAKDKRISRQGVIQAAVQATGGDFEAAEELATKMLEFVNR